MLPKRASTPDSINNIERADLFESNRIAERASKSESNNDTDRAGDFESIIKFERARRLNRARLSSEPLADIRTMKSERANKLDSNKSSERTTQDGQYQQELVSQGKELKQVR
jgi:hypothetical protein